MYEICKHVNFMFQFGIIINCLFTFQKILFFFFSKYLVFGYLPKPRVNTQKIFTYPLGIYPPHITIHTWTSPATIKIHFKTVKVYLTQTRSSVKKSFTKSKGEKKRISLIWCRIAFEKGKLKAPILQLNLTNFH